MKQTKIVAVLQENNKEVVSEEAFEESNIKDVDVSDVNDVKRKRTRISVK